MKNAFVSLTISLLSAATTFAAPKIVSNYGPAANKAVGIDIVAKATEFREKKDLAAGEAYLNAERRAKGTPLAVEWEQCFDMARFALYREEKTKDAEMNELLDHVVAKGETSFWGTAALGWLNVRGRAPISVYWPWRKGQLVAPETTIVYGVDLKFKDGGDYTIALDGVTTATALELHGAAGLVVRLTPEAPQTFHVTALPAKTVTSLKIFVEGDDLPAGEVKIHRHIATARKAVPFAGLPLPQTIAGAYIRRTVGEATIKAIGEKEGGEAFLTRFFHDNDWLEQFAGSGPWSCESRQGLNENLPRAAKALLALDMLVANDHDDFILGTKLGRNCATALALNHGADKDDDTLVDLLSCYRAWAKDGSLVPMAKDYDVREWREVLGFGQNVGLAVDDLRWSNGFATGVPASDYGAMCWQCSYRSFNCFGESVQGPHYYRAWQHRLGVQEMRYLVGGVCGGLSKFGSHVAAAHGIRSFTAGQPMHCAYLLWDYAKARWDVAYSVTGHTMPHNSLGGLGFAAANEQQRYYTHPRRMEAEALRWQGKYEKAMRLVPGNWTAAVAWYNRLEQTRAPLEQWNRYGAAVRETFRDMPSHAWQLYLPYLLKLPTREMRIAAAKDALTTIVESPTDDVEAAYFDEIALNPLKDLFKNDKDALWDLYDAVLDGQASTKTFYRQTVNWGATHLIADEASTKRFMAVIGRSVENTGATLDYKEMLLTASKNGDNEMWAQVYALLDKCSPNLKSQPSGSTWPEKKLGAKLLSADGLLMTSTTSNWDWPLAYRNALSPIGYAEQNSFHTAREKVPWGMVKLPGPAEIKAITVVNSGEGNNAARQLPLVVWVSEDGKTFSKLATFTKLQSEWQIELPVARKARYVKVGREPEAKNEFFHLHKILVYGKKLY